MIYLKRKLCILLAVLFCFAFLASCTDENGNTSSNTELQYDTTNIVSDKESDIVSDNSVNISAESSFDKNDVSVGNSLKELNSFPMTFTKISDALYRMECDSPDGNTLFLTFDKKSWGTYNIGTWTVKDDNGNLINLAGSGTDWEYVFRAGETEKECEWSGGNHGNELLVDIAFYNGKTDKKLDLTNNVPVELDNLKIVEKTKLHWGDVNNTYCDVIRSYTVVGNQISLDVSFKYTKDCYHKLSYTCMFPVDKKYGLYCAFVGTDNNVIDAVETLKVGAKDYTGKQYSSAAARCVIWGYVNPSYKFDVNVSTIADSCDNFKNANKTFYWDMNETHNKLYFSKYDNNAPTLVKSGSQYTTHSTWTFYVD